MKKTLSIVLLSICLLGASFILFACNSNGNNPFAELSKQVETYQTDTTVFNVGETNGYTVKNVTLKTQDGTLSTEETYGDYNRLCSQALWYIEKYTPSIQEIKDANFSQLESATARLSQKYDKMKNQSRNVASVESNANYLVYNGEVIKLRNAMREFTNEAYSVATNLGAILMDNASYSAEVCPSTDKVQLFYDSQMLNILSCCNEYFYTSCQGEQLTHVITTKVKTVLNSTGVKDGEVKKLNADEWKDLYENGNRIYNQTEFFKQSANRFSIYDLIKDYDSNLEAYAKDNQLLKADFNQLNSQKFTEYVSYLKNLAVG